MHLSRFVIFLSLSSSPSLQSSNLRAHPFFLFLFLIPLPELFHSHPHLILQSAVLHCISWSLRQNRYLYLIKASTHKARHQEEPLEAAALWPAICILLLMIQCGFLAPIRSIAVRISWAVAQAGSNWCHHLEHWFEQILLGCTGSSTPALDIRPFAFLFSLIFCSLTVCFSDSCPFFCVSLSSLSLLLTYLLWHCL